MIWPYDVDLWPFDLDACQLHSPKHLMTSDLWPRRLSVTQSQAAHDLWPFDLDTFWPRHLSVTQSQASHDLWPFDLDACQLHSLMTSDLLTLTLVSYTVPSSSWPLTFWPRRLSVTQSQASHDFWPFDLDACQLQSQAARDLWPFDLDICQLHSLMTSDLDACQLHSPKHLMTSDLLTLTLVSYTVPSISWLSVLKMWWSTQVVVNAAVVPRDRLAVSLEQIHNQVQLVSVLHQTTTTFNGSLHVQQASELNVFNVQYCGKHRWFFKSWSHILTHCSNLKMQWLASLG